jgi:hypothetical protein
MVFMLSAIWQSLNAVSDLRGDLLTDRTECLQP